MKKFFRMKLFNFKGIQKFNSVHAEKVEQIDGYAAEKDQLDQSIANFEQAEDLLTSDRKGITSETATAKKAMAETVTRVARKALPFARKAKLIAVVAQLNRSETYILKAAGLTALSRARVLLSTLLQYNSVLTCVTSEDVEDMQQKIEAYTEVHQNPKILRETRKMEGSEFLRLEYQKASAAVQNMHDFIYGHYKSTQPQLLKEFEDYLYMEGLNTKHTALMAHCFVQNEDPTQQAVDVEGIELSIPELNEKTQSDILGMCKLSKFKGGAYRVQFNKEGFESREFQLEFKNGHKLELEVEMKKVG